MTAAGKQDWGVLRFNMALQASCVVPQTTLVCELLLEKGWIKHLFHLCESLDKEPKSVLYFLFTSLVSF